MPMCMISVTFFDQESEDFLTEAGQPVFVPKDQVEDQVNQLLRGEGFLGDLAESKLITGDPWKLKSIKVYEVSEGREVL
jgi:hypothetical protein